MRTRIWRALGSLSLLIGIGTGCVQEVEGLNEDEMAGLLGIAVLHSGRIANTRARIRDLGGNLVAFESPWYYDDREYRTAFVARKCLVGFRFDDAHNRCVPVGDEGDAAPGTESATGLLFSRSAAKDLCAQESGSGVTWGLASETQLRCLFSRHHAPVVYEALVGRAIWGSPISADGSSSVSLQPQLLPAYTFSTHANSEQLHALCTAATASMWFTCRDMEAP